MAFGHVILREFHVDRQAPYRRLRAVATPTCPMLAWLVKQDAGLCWTASARAILDGGLGEANNTEWKTVV